MDTSEVEAVSERSEAKSSIWLRRQQKLNKQADKKAPTVSVAQVSLVPAKSGGVTASINLGKLFDGKSPACSKASAQNAVAALAAAHSPTRANLLSTGKVVNLTRILPCLSSALPQDNGVRSVQVAPIQSSGRVFFADAFRYADEQQIGGRIETASFGANKATNLNYLEAKIKQLQDQK